MKRVMGCVVMVAAIAGCGSKKPSSTETPASGSAAPASGSAAPAAGSGTVSAETSSDAPGSAAAGSAAVATIDPCAFLPREKLMDLTSNDTTTPVPVTASVLGGCTFEAPNRYITIEARPVSELATLAAKAKRKPLTGFPAHATALEDPDRGDVYVTFQTKPYLFHVHVDAGERNPDVRLATDLAKIVSSGVK